MSYVKPDALVRVPITGGELLLSPGYDVIPWYNQYMDKPRIDITGQLFGKLKVIEYRGAGKWMCVCDCGNYKTTITEYLRSGDTKSCSRSCYNKTNNPNLKHGLSRTYFERARSNMITRCYSVANVHYAQYGGRGIKVCDRWLDKNNGLKNFASDIGERPAPNYSIDRIDVNGNYEPSNCRWLDQKGQMRNTRFNRKFVYKTRLTFLIDLPELTGLSLTSIWKKLGNIKNGEDVTSLL